MFKESAAAGQDMDSKPELTDHLTSDDAVLQTGRLVFLVQVQEPFGHLHEGVSGHEVDQVLQ